MPPPNPNKKGFTLIEMILGLSLFALTALTFYAIFSNGVRINRKADQSEQLYRELRWSLDVLTADLENMVTYEGYDENAGPFRGTAESLSLALPTATGLKMIRYSLQPPEQAKIFETKIGEHSKKNRPIVLNYTHSEKIDFLVREELPFFEIVKPGEGLKAEPEVLSTHIQPGSLRFSYGYQGNSKSGDSNLIWKNEWSDARLPAMVRIEVSFVDFDQPGIPLTMQKDILVPVGSWQIVQNEETPQQ